jgi:hypothetical protein
MNDWSRLDRFLRTDPQDVGCGEAMEIMHIYVDLVQAGDDPEALYPGVTAHLRACGPCSDDFQGLLTAVSEMPGSIGT